jgi:hypothetical protein
MFSMDLSIPSSGMQSADAAFDSAARSITQALNQGQPTQLGQASNQGDSADLSSAVAGLLASSLSFIANEKAAIVEDSMTKSTLSILG